MNAWDWSSPLFLRKTTEMCQEIPLFPNQSCWDSLYRRNFMAQSLTISTVLSFSSWRTSILDLSCCTDRNWWAFHAWIDRFADSYRKRISSLSSSLRNSASCAASPTSCREPLRAWHWSHSSLCLWSHRHLVPKKSRWRGHTVIFKWDCSISKMPENYRLKFQSTKVVI